MTKVYVSATFRDLEECRSAVMLALRRLRVEDVAMESYVAEDRRPVERCLADVAECDLYVGIFAWRYGFIPAGYDRSITELEYRHAEELGKPWLIFLLDEEAPWPRIHIDRGTDADKIEALRAELSDRHMCSTFTGPGDLAALVTAAVANCLVGDGPAGGRPAFAQPRHAQALLRPAAPAVRRPRPRRADPAATRGIPPDAAQLGLHRTVRPGGTAAGRAAP